MPDDMQPQAPVGAVPPQMPPQAPPSPPVEIIKTSPNPNALADDAIDRRDTRALTQIAKDNIGTPASDLAMRMVNGINEKQTRFNELVKPIDKAGGANTPNGRVQIAQTFQTVADNPQWGTALLKYVMGDKAGAVKQVTGGDIKTMITYDNGGNQIEERVNELGEPVSYTDRKTGLPVSKDEYAQRVGGISQWANTLKGLTETATRAEGTKFLVKEENQANNFYQLTQAQKPSLQEMYNTLTTTKTDVPKDIYNKTIAAISQSMGQANSNSNSRASLGQLTDGFNRGESVKVDDKIAATLNIPNLIGTELTFKGDRLVSKDNSFSITGAELKQRQQSDTIGSEATKNANSTAASILEAERLGLISSVNGAKLRRTIELSQQIGKELDAATREFGKPSIISLPTSATFVDKQAQVLAQVLQGMQNADQMAEYIKFRNHAVEGHKATNTVPMPGEIGSAYSRQELPKEIRRFYGDEITKVMGNEYTARKALSPSLEVRFPNAEQQPPKAIAPPSKEPAKKTSPSLADLIKQAGGK
jgi:hypothetical protein